VAFQRLDYIWLLLPLPSVGQRDGAGRRVIIQFLEQGQYTRDCSTSNNTTGIGSGNSKKALVVCEFFPFSQSPNCLDNLQMMANVDQSVQCSHLLGSLGAP
jgi:hypothetical protein